jgi:hypothetical protein
VAEFREEELLFSVGCLEPEHLGLGFLDAITQFGDDPAKRRLLASLIPMVQTREMPELKCLLPVIVPSAQASVLRTAKE